MSDEAGGALMRQYTEEELKAAWEEMVRRADASPVASGEPHVVFHIGHTRFALPAAACRGVVPYVGLTPLPSLPRHILGIAGVRGRTQSVTDLSSLLGLYDEGGRDRRGHLLLLKVGEDETALKVDWVDDLKPLDASRCGPVPPEWRGNRQGLVVGVHTAADGGTLIVLDPRRCLRAAG